MLYGNCVKALGYFIFLVVYSGIVSHCYSYNMLIASQSHGSRKSLNEIETTFVSKLIGHKMHMIRTPFWFRVKPFGTYNMQFFWAYEYVLFSLIFRYFGRIKVLTDFIYSHFSNISCQMFLV